MLVLQDTCAIMMLLRIVPQMFTDPAYECTTIRQIFIEYTRKPQFKHKYPWRNDYARHIRTHSEVDLKKKGFDLLRRDIGAVCQAVENPKTGRRYVFELSPTDQDIAAALLALDAELCTGDNNLALFVSEQLEVKCHAPLAILNNWIEKGLVVWCAAYQDVISEWVASEKPQPRAEIRRFEKLTSGKYPR